MTTLSTPDYCKQVISGRIIVVTTLNILHADLINHARQDGILELISLPHTARPSTLRLLLPAHLLIRTLQP
jgi:hypothetical protein